MPDLDAPLRRALCWRALPPPAAAAVRGAAVAAPAVAAWSRATRWPSSCSSPRCAPSRWRWPAARSACGARAGTGAAPAGHAERRPPRRACWRSRPRRARARRRRQDGAARGARRRGGGAARPARGADPVAVALARREPAGRRRGRGARGAAADGHHRQRRAAGGHAEAGRRAPGALHDQPRLESVRRAVARDLDRVRAVGVADIATLGIRLDEAVRLVDELPLLSQPDAAPSAAAGAAGGPAARRRLGRRRRARLRVRGRPAAAGCARGSTPPLELRRRARLARGTARWCA